MGSTGRWLGGRRAGGLPGVAIVGLLLTQGAVKLNIVVCT
jgi:hypothetical protein